MCCASDVSHAVSMCCCASSVCHVSKCVVHQVFVMLVSVSCVGCLSCQYACCALGVCHVSKCVVHQVFVM